MQPTCSRRSEYPASAMIHRHEAPPRRSGASSMGLAKLAFLLTARTLAPGGVSECHLRLGTVSARENHGPFGIFRTSIFPNGTATGLPSGADVARQVGEAPLALEDTGLAALGWPGETPLWYYVLREAAVRVGGGRLGPVGSLIVGEVLLGVIDKDPRPSDRRTRAGGRACPAASPGGSR
jgi:hypothetical protein